MKTREKRAKGRAAEKNVSGDVEYSYATPVTPPPKKPRKQAGEQAARPRLRAIEGGKRRRKIRTFITFAVLLLIVAALVFLNTLSPGGLVELSETLYAGFHTGSGFPVRLPDERVEQLYLSGSDLVVLTDAALLEYNNSAYQMFYRQHGMGTPVVDTMSSRVLIYDRGGKTLKIENRYETVHEETLENSILLGRLNESGSFVIATRSQRYSAEIKVFDGHKFQNSYTRYLVAGEITGLDISRDGTHIVYSVVEARNGEFVSTVYICDIGKKDPIATQVYENAFIVAVDYKENDRIAVLGDSMFSSLDKTGAGRVDHDYEGRYLKLADRTKKGFSALVLAEQTGDLSGTLLLISAKGEVLADFVFDQELRDIACTDDGIYGLFGRQLVLLDRKGAQKKVWETGQDVSDIIERNGCAVLLKNSEISIIDPESQ